MHYRQWWFPVCSKNPNTKIDYRFEKSLWCVFTWKWAIKSINGQSWMTHTLSTFAIWYILTNAQIFGKITFKSAIVMSLGNFFSKQITSFWEFDTFICTKSPIFACGVIFFLIRQNEMGCYLSTVRICCECCDKLLLVDLSQTWQLLDEPREVGNFSILDNLRFMVKALCQAFERVQVYLWNEISRKTCFLLNFTFFCNQRWTKSLNSFFQMLLAW